MDSKELSELAAVLRYSGENILNGTAKFSMSTSTLSHFNVAFDSLMDQGEIVMTSSFHVAGNSTTKLRDLNFIKGFIQRTKTLKIFQDETPLNTFIDISKFENLIFLEICKVDINIIQGVQKLRSQLQQLVCHQCCDNLSDVLTKCGCDKGHSYCWNELKEASFTYNRLVELDGCLEYTPWLHTLDISHNQISNIDALNCLGNLKQLNVAYNKLESIPQFRGQICNRLQNLILKNNFIEDISGLQSLVNVCVLDLSNNCLLDHHLLVSLSHLATLQWLSLDGNPMSLHPLHRARTSTYLHLNTSTTRFMLDYKVLDKSERVLKSLFEPTQSRISLQSSYSMNSPAEKGRKVRVVKIEDSNIKQKPPTVSPSTSSLQQQQHLDTKKRIEELREQFGEFWLNQQSGSVIDNVLGLEKTELLTEQPILINVEPVISNQEEPAGNLLDISGNTSLFGDNNSNLEDEDDGEDVDLEGEECIFLAIVGGETEQIFLILTKTHFSEKESATSKERLRWHIKSINDCRILEEEPLKVELNFETMRKDRQKRIYEMIDADEVNRFTSIIREKIDLQTPKRQNATKYLCMKCSAKFLRKDNARVSEQVTIKCPKCDSNLIVEDL